MMVLQSIVKYIFNIFIFFLNLIHNKLTNNIKKTKTKTKTKKIYHHHEIINQDEIYKIIIDNYMNTNNIITRQLQNTSNNLYEFDKLTPLNTNTIKLPDNKYLKCYGCSKIAKNSHPVYVFSCFKCGNIFQKFRHYSKNLNDKIAFVSGVRTKLGHQITLKLLRAGCKVIGTTRYPEKALKIYESYSDYEKFKLNLHIYPKPLDFDSSNMIEKFKILFNYINENFGFLNILINCAAQTIRSREKNMENSDLFLTESNRYNDPKYADSTCVNSWQMELNDIMQNEMEEVYRVNAIAPCLLIQTLIPLMKLSKNPPYIINVHAREGLINVKKSKFHIHLNMAKIGLSMLSKCLISIKLKTIHNELFRIHGVDPGWISVDEYYEKNRPWNVPPLDEIDGASRILYPLFANLQSSSKTRRHFHQLIS